MVAIVTPPNPTMEFITTQKGSNILSPVAFRFLTNIEQAINGEPPLIVAGAQIAQFSFGTVTLSTGPLDSPEGNLVGAIGDAFISTTAGLGIGNVLFLKESNPGGNTGWIAIG